MRSIRILGVAAGKAGQADAWRILTLVVGVLAGAVITVANHRADAPRLPGAPTLAPEVAAGQSPAPPATACGAGIDPRVGEALALHPELLGLARLFDVDEATLCSCLDSILASGRTPARPVDAVSAANGFLVTCVPPMPADPSTPAVGGYALVRARRVSPWKGLLTLRARLANPLLHGLSDVQALATTDSSAAVVVDGRLTFGSVGPGAIAESRDTFTIQYDLTVPSESGRLFWAVGVQLPGPIGAPAVAAMFNLPPAAVDPSQIDNGLITTRLEVWLAPDATVGTVNDVLSRVGGTIVSMLAGGSVLSVAIPRPPDAAALLALAQALEGAPGIRRVRLAREGQSDDLPVPPGDFLDTHLLPTRFPAAWNASSLLFDRDGNCAQPKVPVLVADRFRQPPDVYTRNVDLGPGVTPFADNVPGFSVSPVGSLSADPDSHGYEVALVLGATFDGFPKARTGANPFTECLAITGVPVARLSEIEKVNRLVLSFPPADKFVVNHSVSFRKDCMSDPCAPSDFGPLRIPGAAERAEYGAYWKQRTFDRWPDFVAVSSAGNRRDEKPAKIYPAIGLATTNSSINVGTVPPDELIHAIQDQTAWWPAIETVPPFPNLTADAAEVANVTVDLTTPPLGPADNVLMVGSTTSGATTADLVESEFSNTGSDVKAVGEQVPSADGGQMAGTSFTAPQVAGLVSYLWLLSPDLRSATVPASTARRAILANARDGVLDAYAAALSLDETGPLTPDSARVRHAILDVIDDEFFDEADLELFLREYFVVDDGGEPERPGLALRLGVAQLTRTPVAPVARDYGRFDLNGDGFTGGDTTERFDLDRGAGSTRFDESGYGVVSQTIEGESVSFDERALTDLKILCYYAYSPLYDGLPEPRRNLINGRCGPVSVTVTPQNQQLRPGETLGFFATVTNATNHVEWSATGGSIQPTSPNTATYTAGAVPGVFSVTATSVDDPSASHSAPVTILGGQSFLSFVWEGGSRGHLETKPPDATFCTREDPPVLARRLTLDPRESNATQIVIWASGTGSFSSLLLAPPGDGLSVTAKQTCEVPDHCDVLTVSGVVENGVYRITSGHLRAHTGGGFCTPPNGVAINFSRFRHFYFTGSQGVLVDAPPP